LSPEQMLGLANTAAGVVVAKLGTATATFNEISEQLNTKT